MLFSVPSYAESQPFIVVERPQLVEPFGEVAVGQDVVHGGGRLKQLDLRQHLKLATSFVEVDQTVVCCVAESGIDHH